MHGIERWLLEDTELSTDLSNERLQMDKLYEKLVADRHNIENWVYAHFHNSNTEFISNTVEWQFQTGTFGTVKLLSEPNQ